MSLRLKALSLGLLAAIALSSTLVANAGATKSGHFTTDGALPVTVVGHESMKLSEGHKMKFASAGLAGVSNPVYCTNATYHGSIGAATTQEVKVKPTYSECTTEPEGSGETVHVNFTECEYKFTSREDPEGVINPARATAGLVCPTGQFVHLEATHSGCKLTFGPQTIADAVTYDTTFENNKHAITLTATGSGISFTAHGGLCTFVGTNRTDGTLTGAVTVTGQSGGNPVNITAT